MGIGRFVWCLEMLDCRHHFLEYLLDPARPTHLRPTKSLLQQGSKTWLVLTIFGFDGVLNS